MTAEKIGVGSSAEAPIDTIANAIAGTIGGWWGTRAAADASSAFDAEEDSVYRGRYEHSPYRLADRNYQTVRPAYQLGYLAKRNPEYEGRDFESIEHELRAGWTDPISSRFGSWGQAREFAREAYAHELSVTSREKEIRENAPPGNFADKVLNENRPPQSRVAGAMDDRRDDKGEDGTAEARLTLPVSRR